MADFVESVGASPATYGLLFHLVIVSPYSTVGGPCHPLVTLFIINFLPSVVKSKSSWIYILSTTLITGCVCTLHLCMNWNDINTLPAIDLLFLYLLGTCAQRGYNIAFENGNLRYPTADNAAHWGGAVAGIVLAVIFNVSFYTVISRSLDYKLKLLACWMFLVVRLFTNY